MIKGNQKEQSVNVKYVGFTSVKVKAINPSRAELNKLLGKEPSAEEGEINYLTTDQDGNERVRLSFWLYDDKLDKYFVHSFNLSKKIRKSRDGVKTQFVNSSCITAWSDVKENLPEWFKYFTDKAGDRIETKEFREALLGEEELVTLVRAWLGKLRWTDPQTSIMLDTDSLFKENYTELRSQIGGIYDTPFIILTGVRTDENDATKQYQQVYGREFLQSSFMDGIKQQFKFKDEYFKRTWAKFEKNVTGQFGFSSYFELSPIKEYDKTKDIAAAGVTKKADVTPLNSKY